MLDAFLFKDKMRIQKNRSMTLDAVVEFVEQDIDNKTVFLYRDCFYFPLAIYPVLFPDNKHISKSDSIGDTFSYLTNVFEREKVKSYSDIDTSYTNIYILDPIPAKWPSIMQNEEDFIQITNLFEVVREADLTYSHLYQLKRKK